MNELITRNSTLEALRIIMKSNRYFNNVLSIKIHIDSFITTLTVTIELASATNIKREKSRYYIYRLCGVERQICWEKFFCTVCTNKDCMCLGYRLD